jgi:hypothetical protein
MTDMHREGFEREMAKKGYSVAMNMDGDYVWFVTANAWPVWQAALRYRDEQEKQA